MNRMTRSEIVQAKVILTETTAGLVAELDEAILAARARAAEASDPMVKLCYEQAAASAARLRSWEKEAANTHHRALSMRPAIDE